MTRALHMLEKNELKIESIKPFATGNTTVCDRIFDNISVRVTL